MRVCCDHPGSERRPGRRRLLTSRVAIIGGLTLAAGGGLAVGGWGWLVAAGLAPLILAILPCALTCGLGLCVLGMSGRSRSNAAPTRPAVTGNSNGMIPGGDPGPSSAAPSLSHRQSPNAI
ncbi:MAG: hypothetical protein B7Z76_15750 [Acidiphilium sp. 20-67-58]|nr:MAG: hypothetical protein B7Z76_15750 [Acidiphilium sp. 20-67-58]